MVVQELYWDQQHITADNIKAVHNLVQEQFDLSKAYKLKGCQVRTDCSPHVPST